MRDVEKAAGFLNLFADNVSAGMDVEPIEWIRENVVDQQSARSTHIDFTLSPFLLEPIDKFLNDGTVRHINLMAPTGSGKSTLFVGLLNYLIANDAGNTLVAFQNAQETSDFAATRLFPTIRDNKALKTCAEEKACGQENGDSFSAHELVDGLRYQGAVAVEVLPVFDW